MSFSEFNTAVLGDLVTIKGGKRLPKGASLISEKNSHPYIKVKDMNGGKKVRLSKTFEYVDDVTQKSIKNYIVNKNDIIISIVGTIGLVSVIDDSLDNANLTENCVKLINLTNVDKDYLYYFLTSDTGQNEMRKGTVGSTQPKLPIYNIKKIELPLPQLDIQKTIAHILSTLDDKIEVNNQINKTLENMAQAIFKQWFVAFEFPNEDGEPYKSSGGEMVESELGMIPKGWEVSKFIDLIEITSGKRPGKRSDMAMEDCKYSLVGASSIMGYTDDFNFEEKILVIGRVGTHGVVQRFNNKVWASDNTLVIKSDKYEFAYQILNLIDYKAINRGSTQPLITQTDIKNHTLIIPTESHLNKFELLVGSLFEIHSNHCLENSKLTELRDTLLPKLMSGEIRVPLDEEGDAS